MLCNYMPSTWLYCWPDENVHCKGCAAAMPGGNISQPQQYMMAEVQLVKNANQYIVVSSREKSWNLLDRFWSIDAFIVSYDAACTDMSRR